jgi:hypothetical protein
VSGAIDGAKVAGGANGAARVTGTTGVEGPCGKGDGETGIGTAVGLDMP